MWVALRSSFREINALISISIFTCYYQTLINGGLPPFMGRGTHSATARILNGKEFDRYIIKRKCKTFTKKTKSTASHRERERDAKRRARLRVVLVRGWCLLCCVLCDFLESRPAECPVFCACACCSARPPLSSPYSPSSVGAFCAGASTRC